jgi:methionyl-tRNA synthetase
MPDCGGDVTYAKEEAYFFKLSKYAKRLEDHIWPIPVSFSPKRAETKCSTTSSVRAQGLCVSRTSFSWGIPVDFDPAHVVYVWIDALSNYITFLGYDPEGACGPLYKKYWPADIHIIGKVFCVSIRSTGPSC